MNEPNPAIALGATVAAPAYKDRSTGLIIFGILTLLLGGLCGLLVPLMLFGQVMAAKVPNAPPPNIAAIVPAVVIYGSLAVALIWLGIGSIQARRWGRALLLIFSWTWLIMGIFMTGIMPFVMAKVFANLPADAKTGQPAMPPAAIPVMIIGMTIFFFVFFVLVPAVWIFFYRSRHVKATCEARDPVPGWTDACPLPVLGMCLWLLFSVPMLLLMPLTLHGVMPFFGTYLIGLPGSLFCVAIAVVWAWAAWRLYRLDVRAWWIILISMTVFMASAMLTYAHHDLIEMYHLMGMPEAQIDQIKQTGLLTGNRMNWLMTLSLVPFLGYLLFIKKYLRKS